VSLPLTKVCDAADWFHPEIFRIVRDELREAPRFHRKQWEFALVFHALDRLGLLRPAGEGLVLGGGRERLLYAVAPRVRRLMVTDLYAPDTTWSEARTEDPDRYVREGAPFEADLRSLQVGRMDMRELTLPDSAFDFAYSCCAIEHIGGDDEFARHLREVHRVLRPGGAYVFTTELHYGDETIRDPENFVFGTDGLGALLAASPFQSEPACWSGIAPHAANRPLPEDFSRIFDAGALGAALRDLPHVQLLRGRLPHSSAALVLRKARGRPERTALEFPGLADSRRFLDEAADDYRRWLEASTLPLDPCGYMDQGRSPFLDGFRAGAAPASPLFHTRYAWLGGGRRRFTLSVSPAAGGTIELRVHRQRTHGGGRVEAEARARVDLAAAPVEAHVDVDVEAGSSYAFMGEFVSGACQVRQMAVTVGPSNGA
jgi:SAM-dependent methyltransferase